MHKSRDAEDSQTFRHLQDTQPNDAVIADPAHNGFDDDDSDDAVLLESVRKLEVYAAPVPAANLNRGGDHNRDQRGSSEEIFPSPGTRAGDEKNRRTRAAKAAPYFPPKGTRAASMIEKEQAR